MTDWTIIVDDNCGTTKVYVVSAMDVASAAAYALSIYEAHQSSSGRVQWAFAGEPEFVCWDERYAYQKPDIIDLRGPKAA